METLWGPALVLMAVVILVGAIVQGSVGFGHALVSAPVAMLVLPELVPGPIIVVSLGVTLATLARDHKTMGRPQGLLWILVGLFPGLGLGSQALVLLSLRETDLFFGGAVLVTAGISFAGWRVRIHPLTLVPAGLLAGFMSITTTMGGPPLAIALQELPGPQLRGTLAFSFIVSTLTSLSVLHAIHRFGSKELSVGLSLLPFALLGVFLSAPLAHWLDRGRTRTAVLLLAAAAGLLVIIRQLTPT
ncbi:MAG: sulfite exporter TauE/SafE family protein [Magnetococcales bacterium]|nr:sulfite exporter TauE/SafE family protein [Magnetococcales bacterium]